MKGVVIINTNMLKALVELADNNVDCINTSQFFSQFPKNASNLNDLRLLSSLGFISIIDADDDIDDIGVSQKAIDYFK